MSIRAKLLLSITVLVATAFVVTGFVVVTQVRAHMIDRVDTTLIVSRDKYKKPSNNAWDQDRKEPPAATSTTGPSKRELAFMSIGPGGNIIQSQPSGFDDDPDPLPDLDGLSDLRPGEFYTVGAVGDSSLRYRLLVTDQFDGRVDLLAAPMDDVDDTVRQLMLVIGITGAIVVVGLSLITWIILRRGLAPVHEMAGTATLVAGGDLSQRVGYEDPNTEVGQLGLAFNSMVSQIEAAFEVKDASERRLRQFVADASHELRTPITSIRGYAELYRSGAASSPEEIDRAMYRIEAEGTRMGRLVEDLLLLARLDQGRPLEQEPVDLSRVVEDAVSDARAIEPDRQITYEPCSPAVVLGDEDRLRQVMANLLDNIRQHTNSGTPATVSIETAGGQAMVRVVDQGHGVSPERLERIFDRFYRVDTARSRANGGSGLGLSIVASVVEAHHGQVEATSAPGVGTTFTVTLPLYFPDEGPQPTAEPEDRVAAERQLDFSPMQPEQRPQA